jgi:hypothetical protein
LGDGDANHVYPLFHLIESRLLSKSEQGPPPVISDVHIQYPPKAQLIAIDVVGLWSKSLRGGSPVFY